MVFVELKAKFPLIFPPKIKEDKLQASGKSFQARP